MRIRFTSVLHPEKWGFELTDDSMTFWNIAYHQGSENILNGGMGYYETLGDGTIQHSPLRPCGPEHMTDYLLSFTRHMRKHQEEEFRIHRAGLAYVDPDYAKFLATIVYDSEKPRWYNPVDKKVSASPSKEHDRRWIKVPQFADGTIASAYRLHFNRDGGEHRRHYMLELYSLQESFHDHLCATVAEGYDEWAKIVGYREHIEGDHQSAFRAYKHLVDALELLERAKNAADCAEYNSRLKMEDAAAAESEAEKTQETAAS